MAEEEKDEKVNGLLVFGGCGIFLAIGFVAILGLLFRIFRWIAGI